jgi:Anion-transporting ATPase/Pyridine nucleotide-disulphide oxidoreductase/Pyridine nucleotide-disulphide oxidoreductase, dimerisation domain
MAAALVDLVREPVRFYFFTGKGGVGKTSLASATAVGLADLGRRTLLVSTDPVSNLDAVLGVALGDTPAPVPGAPDLLAMNIDPDAAARAYRARTTAPHRGTVPDAELAQIEEQLAELGLNTAVVERKHLGGICLNWGCIPTKALLRSSEINHLLHHLEPHGFSAADVSFDFARIIQRSRDGSQRLNNGVKFLMKKNHVTVIDGQGRLAAPGRVAIDGQPGEDLSASHIILATGARADAAGITGNVEDIGLEGPQVTVERGHVVVNEWFETGEPGVYAIGDLVGPPWLAHKAMHSGALLGAHMIGAEVTELIQGFMIALTLGATEAQLLHAIFPHPTLPETMGEAMLAAFGRVIHV